MTNPYRSLVRSHVRLQAKGRALPLGGLEPCRRPKTTGRSPKALLFSPHPDDECIVGGLALRLLREARVNVVNVAVTQGSNRERQAARWEELAAACRFLGFGLIQAREGGLEKVNLRCREQEPDAWRALVDRIAGILDAERPEALFVPHAADGNTSHIGTHHLVMDALGRMGSDFRAVVIESEYWAAMAGPNLMVEFDARELADLMAGLSFHVGEVRRNPYHLLLPAWMQDNVRRGGELVGGQGGAAPAFDFAALYRARRRVGGQWEAVWQGGRLFARTAPAADLWRELTAGG